MEGVKDLKQDPNFIIFPNPANDNVTLQLNNSKPGSVKIVDLVGNIVYSETIAGHAKIDVAEFKNGIYFVSVEADGVKMLSRKLVVQH